MFEITITTPDVTLFKGEANAVELPAVSGICTILQNHASTFITLHAGRLKLQSLETNKTWFVTKGSCHFNNNFCTVSLENIIDLSSIDIPYIEQQLKEASAISLEKRQLLEAQLSFATEQS